MNVAVTRARRHVALFGDSDTCSAHPFLRRMVEYFEENGETRSAAQYGAAPGERRVVDGSALRGSAPPPRKDEKEEEERLRAQASFSELPCSVSHQRSTRALAACRTESPPTTPRHRRALPTPDPPLRAAVVRWTPSWLTTARVSSPSAVRSHRSSA